MKKSTKKNEKSLKEEIKVMIDVLIYTNEETKAIYRQQLANSTNSSQLNELKEMIEIGEQQLRKIKKELFQTLESFIWKINAFEYLSMKEKKYWTEALVFAELYEEMETIYDQAMNAEEYAKLKQVEE